MGTKLPDVFDYGARPSLKSNRIDMPDKSGTILAESLVSAQNTFMQIAGEQKQKRDRMNYALAKNELLQADIAAREQLRDDEDWGTYDERYTEKFNTSRDAITAKYIRDKSDSALFAAESDLMRERGRINVADAARRVEVDEKSATLDQQLLDGRELVLMADPSTANDVMLSLLDSINAAKDEFLDDEEALKKSQAFVADVATARLVAMDPKLREQELERSLAARSANGPIDEEAIRAGKGTDSIADFLTADVATKMLNQVKKENELDMEFENAIGLRDEAEALFPEDSAEMNKWIKEEAKRRNYDARTRGRAESMGQAETQRRKNAEADARNDIIISATDLLSETDEDGNLLYTFEDLPRDDLSKLSNAQRTNLELYSERLRRDQNFADVTNYTEEVFDENGDLVTPRYTTWADMSFEDKAKQDLNEAKWRLNFTRDDWRLMVNEQERVKKALSSTEKSIQTLNQITDDVWTGDFKMPKVGKDFGDDERIMYSRARSTIASRVDHLSDNEYDGKMPPDDEVKRIAREVMGQTVYERDAKFGISVWGFDSKKPMPITEVDPDHPRDYYVPINEWRNLETKVMIGDPPEEKTLTWEAYLNNIAATELDGRKPAVWELENAFAQVRIGGDPAEVKHRVLEALSGKYER